MNNTVQLIHDRETHTVTLTLQYDDEASACAAYVDLLAFFHARYPAAVINPPGQSLAAEPLTPWHRPANRLEPTC